MSFSAAATQARHYAVMAALLLVGWYASETFGSLINQLLTSESEVDRIVIIFSAIVSIFAMGFIVCEVARPTIFPSFVVAIFFGIATRGVLVHLTQSPLIISTLIHIGAVLILFEGGLQTPFRKFWDLIGPILSLAFIGTIVQAFFFSLILANISEFLEVEIPIVALTLIGATLASTDPAAIIPSLQSLFFRNATVKHIAISESAINDVVGAVLVGIFLTIFESGITPLSVVEAYSWLLEWSTILLIAKMLCIGAVVGLLGFGILSLWNYWKTKHPGQEEGDTALFLAVPLFVFTLSSGIGGSGFLASFIAGLCFRLQAHVRHVEHYFQHTIEDFLKPVIFILLGAMTNPAAMLQLAGLGLLAGFVFLVVLRPFVVFVSLWPTMITRTLSFKELVFLSFVRETGVIPAVLLITIYLSGMPGSETILVIGLWVILLSLIIEPPLTPLLARTLGLATNSSDVLPRKHSGPVVVLCSRGYSYMERLDTVTDWALQHSVENVVLLHCPEDKYTEEFMKEVRQKAENQFRTINRRLSNQGLHKLSFEFIGGPGLLQEHIEEMIQSGDVSIVFVGSKMLDYRLADIREMQVPFYFMP